MNIYRELIQNIKDCGQSLIDNAEKIADNFKYTTDITITCYPNVKDTYPHVVVEQEFVPEKIIQRYM